MDERLGPGRPPHRLDGQDGAPHRLAGAHVVRGRARAHHRAGTARMRPGGGRFFRARPGKRLLVLGAGPAQLGLLEAARARELSCDRARPRPGRAGLPLRRPAGDRLHRGRARRSSGSPAPSASTGSIAPGIDWPVAIAARVAERLGLPHPISPETAALVDVEAAPARALRRGGSAAAARTRSAPARRRRRGGAGDVGFPCVVKAPDRQGQRGLSLVRLRSDARRGASRVALDASRGGDAARRGARRRAAR